MEQGWILVFSTNKLPEAEMIKGLLDEHGIVAVNLNKQSSAHLIGEVEVYVKNTDLVLAKQLILKQQEE
jgi:hypothetical protein